MSDRGDQEPRRPPAAVVLAEIDELEVEIEKLVAGGDGLARHLGVPIFVPRSAPGDRLRVRLTERRPDYGRAEIVELLEGGADRREPPCPHFDRCGGCDLQHLTDAAQVRLKAAAVRETLERLGGIAWPERVEIVSGAPWGYRLRCRLRVESGADGPQVGYYERGSHRLVPIERCPVLDPALEREAVGLAGRLGESPPQRLDLAVGGDGRLTAAPVVPGLGRGEVRRRVGDDELAYDARTFFQGHGGLLETLVASVVGSWTGERAVDLYAGVGLFSLPLARRYTETTAVEGDRVAARYLGINARRNRIAGLAVEARAVESWIVRLSAGADRVVVDPPRRGLPPKVRAFLTARPARRLTYVSCHPAALARDLAQLAVAYRLEGLTLLDLFPQTGHIEAVAQLVAA